MSHLGFEPSDVPSEPRGNPNLYLAVRVAAGAPLEATCAEACGLASRLFVGVRFSFSGTEVVAWPTSTPAGLVETWRRAQGSVS